MFAYVYEPVVSVLPAMGTYKSPATVCHGTSGIVLEGLREGSYAGLSCGRLAFLAFLDLGLNCIVDAFEPNSWSV